MNKKLNPWAAVGVALLYLLFVFASCFIGFLHPACWAYFSVLAAILGGGVLADIVRQFMGNGSRKALYCAYPFLAIGNIGWIIRLWSDKQFYYDGAVEEMGQAYAEGIKALQTPGHLVAVIVLTAAIAVLGIWLCTKADKKSSKLLD